jgi:hypothetical protein
MVLDQYNIPTTMYIYPGEILHRMRSHLLPLLGSSRMSPVSLLC